VVRVAWQDPTSGETHTATSDYVWDDPGPRLASRAGVKVLFDPNRPSRSLVDLDADPAGP